MESTRLTEKVQPLSAWECSINQINQRVLTISQRDTKYKWFFAKGRANIWPGCRHAAAAAVEERAAALL
jgi:hypothetical protein